MRYLAAIAWLGVLASSFAFAIQGTEDEDLDFEFDKQAVTLWDEFPNSYLFLKITNTGEELKTVNVAYYPLGLKAVDSAGEPLEWTQEVEALKTQSIEQTVELSAGESHILVYKITEVFETDGSERPYKFSFLDEPEIEYEFIRDL